MENPKEKIDFKDRKVISIGVVSELTGLSLRKLRYYEERRLIFPERTNGGTRKYSFRDVETLFDIAEKVEDGVQTFEIRQDMKRQASGQNRSDIRKKMIQGQLNTHFHIKKNQ